MLIENLFPQSVFGKGFHCCRPNGLEDWNLFVLFRSETYVFQDGGYVLAEPGELLHIPDWKAYGILSEGRILPP